MARLISAVGGEPVNEGERRVVSELLRALPEDYGVLPNVEVVARNGQRYEIDCVVTTPHAIYVIEIKAYRRAVVGDDREWLVGDRAQAAPIRPTSHKARVLKGMLQDGVPLLRRAWVEPLVVLAYPPASLQLSAEARRTTLSTDELIDALSDVGRLPRGPSDVDRLPARAERVLESIARQRSGPRVFGQWEVIETLEADDEIAHFRAIDRFAPHAPPRRLRVCTVSPYRLTAAEIEAQRAKLVREYTALAHMGPHPNIVGAHHAFEEGDAVVVVSDEPEGVSLGLLLGEGLDMTDDERVTYLDGLCAAAEHAHANGVIHRRITPEAVMISQDETHLTGFGSARILSEGTIYHDPTTIDADRRFIAPEVVDPSLGDISEATDLFGIAAIAFTLWSGQPPWSESWRARLEVVERPEDMPEALWTALAPLLAANPDERTTSLPDLRRALGRCRQQDDTVANAEPSGQAPLEYAHGDLIDERYLVRSKLGSGNFSTVYRVHDTVADHDVALKVFHRDFGLDAVQRELQALLQVRHPNVVEVIDVGKTSTTPRQWFIKSHLAQGSTLEARTEPSSLLDPDEAVRVIDQLLDACIAFHPDERRIAELKAAAAERELDDNEHYELQELTERGLVHGDIKPQNVMYDETTGRALLLDFNIAASNEAPGVAVAGTPGYQPPDANLTTTSITRDLFALGVLLFELLTGEHPYEGRRPVAGRLRALHSIRPDLPEALDRLCATACAAQADERYSSAHDMRQALRDMMPAAFGSDSDQPAIARGDNSGGAVASDPMSADTEPGPTSEVRLPGRTPVVILTTSGNEVVFALDHDSSTDDNRVVLSATALDGRHYLAPRGARAWLPGNRLVSLDEALIGEWTLLADGDENAAAPRLLPQEQTEGLWVFRAERPVDLGGARVDIEVHIRDNRGDAVIDVRCSPLAAPPSPHQPGAPVTQPPPPSTPVEPTDAEFPDPAIERFIRGRVGHDTERAAPFLTFLWQALDRGDVQAETGRSVRTADGKTDYLMLHWTGPGRTAALAYVKPAQGLVDFRLPEGEAAGRRHTEVLSPGHRAYRVRLRLDQPDSIAEGADLLDRAVRLAGGATDSRPETSIAAARHRKAPPGDGLPPVADPKERARAPEMARLAKQDGLPEGANLERYFHDHMVDLARRTIRETGYRPTAFMQMLQERGGLAAARHLLTSPQVSSGFTTLWEMQRLDLTVEAIVVDPPWSDLFTRSEIGTARKRLKQHGYGHRA